MPPKVAFAITAETAVFALLLFGSAGTVDWPAGWIFMALFFVPAVLLTASLARSDPALLAERMKPMFQKDQPVWDRVFLAVIGVAFLGWLVLMGLDAGRYHWTHMPPWLAWAGAADMLAGWWICHRVFRANTFVAPVVKIQSDRRQTVVTTGPYAVVRHPFYAGAMLLIFGSALVLGSWLGVAGALVLVLGVCVRIPLEERELERGLSGYPEYKARVRHRLIPFIW